MRNVDRLMLVCVGSMTILMASVILGIGLALLLNAPKIVMLSLLSPIISVPLLWIKGIEIEAWLNRSE